MKQIAITVFIMLVISMAPSLSAACTSFAESSHKTVHGTNFVYSTFLFQKFAISDLIFFIISPTKAGI